MVTNATLRLSRAPEIVRKSTGRPCSARIAPLSGGHRPSAVARVCTPCHGNSAVIGDLRGIRWAPEFLGEA